MRTKDAKTIALRCFLDKSCILLDEILHKNMFPFLEECNLLTKGAEDLRETILNRSEGELMLVLSNDTHNVLDRDVIRYFDEKSRYDIREDEVDKLKVTTPTLDPSCYIFP